MITISRDPNQRHPGIVVDGRDILEAEAMRFPPVSGLALAWTLFIHSAPVYHRGPKSQQLTGSC